MRPDCYNKWATMHKIIESDSLIDGIQARLQRLQRVAQCRSVVMFQLLQDIVQGMTEGARIGFTMSLNNQAVHAQQQGSAVAGR